MKNVAVIGGGFSSEFEISILSCKNIIANFPETYSPYLVLITKEGWFVELDGERIPFDEKEMAFVWKGNKIKIDLSIIYVHGNPGENGKLQAYFDMMNIPYLNSGALASELSFDKWYCNQFLKGFGFNVAKSIYLTDKNDIPLSHAMVELLGLPIFVKPCDSGSSYGISKVNNEEDLKLSILEAFKEGRTVVAEGFLDGTEVTCGVYRSSKGVQALPITEIVSENDFFDFEAKYKGLSEEITPARINDELTKKVQAISKDVYNLLQLKSIARVDFMLVDNEPYIIEVNTTPGFSNESIVPKMINSAGLSIKEFWNEILEGEFKD